MSYTCAQFNRDLQNKGYDIELVRGDGYFYWIGVDWPSEYIMYFNHYSRAKWQEVFAYNLARYGTETFAEYQ